MSVGTLLTTTLLLMVTSTAFAQTSCGSDEGCCQNGIQYQTNFFPFCSKTRKVADCIWPSKTFLRAAKLCKEAAQHGRKSTP